MAGRSPCQLWPFTSCLLRHLAAAVPYISGYVLPSKQGELSGAVVLAQECQSPSHLLPACLPPPSVYEAPRRATLQMQPLVARRARPAAALQGRLLAGWPVAWQQSACLQVPGGLARRALCLPVQHLTRHSTLLVAFRAALATITLYLALLCPGIPTGLLWWRRRRHRQRRWKEDHPQHFEEKLSAAMIERGCSVCHLAMP